MTCRSGTENLSNNCRCSVPRLCLGTHCQRGSASRMSRGQDRRRRSSGDARQSLAGSAFPGRAWEREGNNQRIRVHGRAALFIPLEPVLAQAAPGRTARVHVAFCSASPFSRNSPSSCAHLEEFYGPTGYAPAGLLDESQLDWWVWSMLIFNHDDPAVVYPMFGLWVAVTLAFTAGFCTRLMNVALWFLTMCFFAPQRVLARRRRRYHADGHLSHDAVAVRAGPVGGCLAAVPANRRHGSHLHARLAGASHPDSSSAPSIAPPVGSNSRGPACAKEPGGTAPRSTMCSITC